MAVVTCRKTNDNLRQTLAKECTKHDTATKSLTLQTALCVQDETVSAHYETELLLIDSKVNSSLISKSCFFMDVISNKADLSCFTMYQHHHIHHTEQLV